MIKFIRRSMPCLLGLAIPAWVAALGFISPELRPVWAAPLDRPSKDAAQPVLQLKSSRVASLDGTWLLAVDPDNIGRKRNWFNAPVPEAKPAQVPWIIQDAFPGYHGVAWFWREFVPAPLPEGTARFLLRFWGVDFSGEVWLNGMAIGQHEGGETPFVLDVTSVLKVGVTNRLAVRVLNPTHTPIDGLVLTQTPRQARVIPYSAGAAYNCGGITESVELLAVPLVRIEDLFALPDPNSGVVQLQVTVQNTSGEPASRLLECSIAPAAAGETVLHTRAERSFPPGRSVYETELKLEQPRRWDINDPFLYRVTSTLRHPSGAFSDEASVRCGFRDFRFENGYFRLNGRRIFLRSSHTCNHFPIGQRLPHDPDLARRDLLDVKAMGFNAIRFIWGGAERYQLDLCDEIGLMVYEESFASMPMADSPKMADLFDHCVGELIRRDRNHPSIVIWGLLNEAGNDPAFRHATKMLPLVRALDPSRMVFLNAGRFDGLTANSSGPFSAVNIWHSEIGREPWLVRNPLTQPVETPFGFSWPPGQICLHPGEKGEFSVARWVAPHGGECQIEAAFQGLPSSPATTDVHVLHNGRELFNSSINIAGRPNTASFSGRQTVAQGDTIDFVVGYGNGSYGSDSTGLKASIQFDSTETYNLARDFSAEHNPHGAWRYGLFEPGATPNAGTFRLYAETGKQVAIGSIANPGSPQWEDLLIDRHHYPRVPHTAGIISELRSMSGSTPIFLSEYGIGSAVDLWRTTRHFEQLGYASAEDALFYRDKLDRFLKDWQNWKLDELYARPEDFFAESLRKMAGQRTLGLNAIRANPRIIGYSLTGMNDHVSCGEGLTTTFRELKPGTVDALFEGFAPLRWCLFAEPVNSYTGTPVRLEALLANEDALIAGEYPVRIQVMGPDNARVWERRLTLRVPERTGAGEPALVIPLLNEAVSLAGGAGRYRLLASLERGGAPTGGETEFYREEARSMPGVDMEVTLWDGEAGLQDWLRAHQIHAQPWAAGLGHAGGVILVGVPSAESRTNHWASLVRAIEGGASAVFLAPEVFQKGADPVGWLPLGKKGSLTSIHGWLYLKDEWAKRHPIFEGLPAGGLMDYTFYREIIPDLVWMGQEPPGEAVAGAIKASQDYASGLMVSVHELGRGRLILNTLRIRENLGTHPAAERLLRNMLRYAGTPRL